MKSFQIQNLWRVGAVATALALGGVAAQAQPGGHGGPGPHRGGGHAMTAPGFFGSPIDGRALKRVDATEAQRSQIKAIYEQARKDLAGQRDSGRQLRQQLATLYTATNIDAAAIESVRTQMAAQHEVAAKRMSQASIEAARVLTPEQRAKIGEMMKKRDARTAERRSR